MESRDNKIILITKKANLLNNELAETTSLGHHQPEEKIREKEIYLITDKFFSLFVASLMPVLYILFLAPLGSFRIEFFGSLAPLSQWLGHYGLWILLVPSIIAGPLLLFGRW